MDNYDNIDFTNAGGEAEDTGILQDRIGEYLIPHLSEFVFDELSEGYLKRAEIADILTGVPIPIKKSELGSLSTLAIAKNMAFVIGCDINFKYRDNYLSYITRTFTKEFAKPLTNEGIESAAKNDFDYACICFRAAILIDPDSSDALYCYGRACKDSYEAGEGEEYIGRYKAESLEAFEKTTLKAPDFDMGYYFLGYAYLNLGLYIKAKLTWETFLKLSDNGELKAEVREWAEKLDEPVKIEEGYNLVLSGHFEGGIEVLSHYENDDRFNSWWPLWYYLGVAYKEIGEDEEAESHLLKTLTLAPSNLDTMKELAELYEEQGDTESAEKYRNKMQVVMHNIELDRAERTGDMS